MVYSTITGSSNDMGFSSATKASRLDRTRELGEGHPAARPTRARGHSHIEAHPCTGELGVEQQVARPIGAHGHCYTEEIAEQNSGQTPGPHGDLTGINWEKNQETRVYINPPLKLPRHESSSGTPYPLANYVTFDNFSQKHRKFLAAITSEVEPRSYAEAVKEEQWREAMAKEIAALEANQTWTLEQLPEGKKPIDCKWVFKIKYKADGTIERYKARLVAKGFTQVEGLDFHETFAPVAKLVSVRVFLSVAVARGWELHQMDVNNAFLHGDLDEEVYMKLPPGFKTDRGNQICRLRKSIYGLRQASRNWFNKLTAALKRYGFVQSLADYSMFTFHKNGVFMGLLIYVDDIILAGNNSEACAAFKAYLNECFHIKDLGALKYFLGIKVAKSPQGLFLCQRKYTLDILAETGLLGGKPAETPMEQSQKLALAEGEEADGAAYRRLVGRLIYLTITRPEISYSVHVLSQFAQAPRKEHFEAALRVVRYLKGSPGQGILLRADSDLRLRAYCDSDWASCPITWRSVTGYFVMLGQSPVSWKTKKQSTVSRSSAEAEYRAMASAASELVWLKSLLTSLLVIHREPMELFCDSQSAIHIAANPVFHERTKHIEIDCHYIRQHIQ